MIDNQYWLIKYQSIFNKYSIFIKFLPEPIIIVGFGNKKVDNTALKKLSETDIYGDI